MFLPREPAWYLEGPVFDSFKCHLGWIPGIQRVAQYPNIQTSLIRSPKKKRPTTCRGTFFFFGVSFHFSTEISEKLVYQMGGLQSLDCEMNGAALPKGWQRQWLMGWNGIFTGSKRTFLFLQLLFAGELVHISLLADVSRTKNLSVCRRNWDVFL